MAGGQALAAGPPVAPVSLNAGLGCSVQWITVKVSDQAPGYIDGKPWIPNPDYSAHTVSSYTSRLFQITGLAAGTTQHILVTATGRDALREARDRSDLHRARDPRRRGRRRDLEDEVIGGDYGGMPYGHDAYFSFQSPPRDRLEFRVYAWIDVAD